MCDIHIRNEFSNTNKQESVNSTFAGRTGLARGINSENSLVYRIFILHYNYIRPHNGISGKTQAEAAGIEIQGHNRWLTLIQNAADAAYAHVFTLIVCPYDRTLPHTDRKPRQAVGIGVYFAENRSKTTPSCPAYVSLGYFLDTILDFSPSPGLAGRIMPNNANNESVS